MMWLLRRLAHMGVVHVAAFVLTVICATALLWGLRWILEFLFHLKFN